MIRRLRRWHERELAEQYRRYPITVTTFAQGRETGTRRLAP